VKEVGGKKSYMNICGKEIKIQGRALRVARVAAEGFEFLEDPEATLDQLRHRGSRIDLFTFTQRLPETKPKYAYPMEWGNAAVLTITTFENWWKQIGNKTRNCARQAAKKGVVVRETPFDDDLVRGIWRIYNECPIRQGRRFLHYGKDLQTVHRITATFLERSFFIGAFLGEELIGFMKLTIDEARSQAAVMCNLSMIQHRDKSPTNALIVQAVQGCEKRGIPHLVYSSFAFGKKRWDSLMDFKKSNGFERIDLPRYYVPLNGWGALALRLGLHHRLADRLPESVAAKLRDARSAWYKRRFQPSMGMPHELKRSEES
jgi:hypothetical protein